MKWTFFNSYLSIPFGNALAQSFLGCQHRLPRQKPHDWIWLRIKAGQEFCLLPSLDFKAQASHNYRIVLKDSLGAKAYGAWIGDEVLPSSKSHSSKLKSQIDWFKVKGDFALKVEWKGPIPANYCLNLHLRPAMTPQFEGCDTSPTHNPLHALCQYDLHPKIGHRLCSPSSTAMLLGLDAPRALKLAQQIYHSPTDLYGIWPMAQYWAQRSGAKAELAWIGNEFQIIEALKLYGPIAVSVKVQAGELEGFDPGQSSGHLCVLAQILLDHVLVYDPASRVNPKIYNRQIFLRCFARSGGLAYLISKP